MYLSSISSLAFLRFNLLPLLLELESLSFDLDLEDLMGVRESDLLYRGRFKFSTDLLTKPLFFRRLTGSFERDFLRGYGFFLVC